MSAISICCVSMLTLMVHKSGVHLKTKTKLVLRVAVGSRLERLPKFCQNPSGVGRTQPVATTNFYTDSNGDPSVICGAIQRGGVTDDCPADRWAGETWPRGPLGTGSRIARAAHVYRHDSDG